MLRALVNGRMVTAQQGGRGTCPDCKATMISKCGDIVTWHWAHEKTSDCDSWCEGESEWHLWWKSKVPQDCCEVSMERNGIKHRADIGGRNGVIVELQHDSLSPQEISDREAFYGNMIWLFDASEFENRLIFRSREGSRSAYYHTFRWLHSRKTVVTAKRPVFFDLGREQTSRELYMGSIPYETKKKRPDSRRIFEVKKFRPDGKGGWGYFWHIEGFIQRYLNLGDDNKEATYGH